MRNKKPETEGGRSKSKITEFFEIYKQNLKFLFIVLLVVLFSYFSFIVLSKIAGHFLDADVQLLFFYFLLAVVLYVGVPFLFDLRNMLIQVIKFVVFPAVLFFLIHLRFESPDFFSSFFHYVLLALWSLGYSIFLSFCPVKNFNYRPAYVVIGCLLLFVLGMFVASNSVFDAATALGFSLNKCGTNEKIPDAHFICEGLREDLFVGEQANCVIYGLEHDNLTTKLNFTHFNGTRSDYAYSSGDSISFIVPANVARVHVNIQSDETGNEYCASSAYDTTFTTYANFRQQRKELGFYFVAIISFILISVPTIVRNWMTLSNRRRQP